MRKPGAKALNEPAPPPEIVKRSELDRAGFNKHTGARGRTIQFSLVEPINVTPEVAAKLVLK